MMQPSVPFDFSELSWSAAFAALCACLKREYVFTDWKGIDWGSLQTRFAPCVNKAEEHRDRQAYYLALREFSYHIPDANLRLWGDDWDLRKCALSGTFGLELVALDDGRILVSRVDAEQEGIRPGAEILSWNDEPVARALNRTNVIWAEHPPTTKTQTRIQQCHFLTRGPNGMAARIQYQNSKGKRVESVTLTSHENDANTPSGPPSWHSNTPLFSKMLPSGIGYFAIHALPEEPTAGFWYSTLYNHFRELLLKFSRERASGLVIDLRNCVGNNHALAARLAGFFHPHPLFYAMAGFKDKAGAPASQLKPYPRTLVQVVPQDIYWSAPIAVIVNSETRGAAEGLALSIQKAPRGAVVGMTTSAGAFGAMTANRSGEVWMPEGYSITFANEAGLNQDGIIQIESNRFGEGSVRPTVRVPRNQRTFEEEFLAGRDVVLTFAEQSCLHARQKAV